jgi:hypothetical protein
MNWLAPHALQVLVSPEHGLFFWTPVAALGIAGLLVAAISKKDGTHRSPPAASKTRQQRPEPATEQRRSQSPKFGDRQPGEAASSLRPPALSMLAMVALQVYVAGSVESWTVAGAFGQRRFVGLSVLLVIGVGALWQSVRTRTTRRLLAAGVALAIWWNVGLIAQFGSGLMDRQRLEPARNAYNTFVVIPRQFPRLVYQYAFERSRFYQKGTMEREHRQ